MKFKLNGKKYEFRVVVRRRSSRSECLRWNTYQKTSDQNDQSALARRRVENKRLRATPGYFHAVPRAEGVSVPTGKGSPEFQASPGSFDSFFGPEQSHSLRAHASKMGLAGREPDSGRVGARPDPG